MQVEVQKEHRWLEKLVGEWTYEHETSPGPDQPPMKFTGTDSVRSLTVWVLCAGEGNMPDGGIGRTLMTLGYDTAKKQFVGTFIGSMMTNLWIYERGELNESETTLTLYADGPSFADPTKTAKYSDAIEFINDDHRTLTSQYQDDNGVWQKFMTAHYKRKK
jgi:hypothetical protein